MKLLILRCPRCSHALAPGQIDFVVQCPNCRAAVEINDGGPALREVQYAAPRRDGEWLWLPFWVYDSRVTIKLRKTQGGHSAEKEAQAYWSQPRRIYIPAWDCDLAEAHGLANELLEDQPTLQPVVPPETAQFQPVVLTSDDARRLLDLIIVSTEAERRDWMENLEYDVAVRDQTLWLLPATGSKENWQLQAKGL